MILAQSFADLISAIESVGLPTVLTVLFMLLIVMPLAAISIANYRSLSKENQALREDAAKLRDELMDATDYEGELHLERERCKMLKAENADLLERLEECSDIILILQGLRQQESDTSLEKPSDISEDAKEFREGKDE